MFCVSVVAILVTAPLGACLIRGSSGRLLEREEEKSEEREEGVSMKMMKRSGESGMELMESNEGEQ